MPINLEDAIKIHSNWKNRLLQATSSGTEVLDPVRIGQDCNCLLGKWLHTEGKIQYGQMPSFNDCVKKHAEFHMQASKVANEHSMPLPLFETWMQNLPVPVTLSFMPPLCFAVLLLSEPLLEPAGVLGSEPLLMLLGDALGPAGPPAF